MKILLSIFFSTLNKILEIFTHNKKSPEPEIMTSTKTYDFNFKSSDIQAVKPLKPEKTEQNSDNSKPTVKLQDNKSLLKLIEENVLLIKRMQNMKQNYTGEETVMIIEQIIDDIKDSLELSGLERIENEQLFSALRHQPVPLRIVKEGQPIVKTLETGLCLGNRVFIKAKVKL